MLEALRNVTPRLRKLVLVTHITFSVGWLGAVVSFFALSIAGLTSDDPDLVRSAYLAMNLIGSFIIVPMSFAALATGLVQALGSPWGLVRHYWVLVKFALAIFAGTALLMHQFTAVAEAAKLVSGIGSGTTRGAELGQVGIQLVAASGLAMLVLLTATTLAVYKPWGLTRYGRRMQQQRRKALGQADEQAVGDGPGLPVGLKIFLTVIAALVSVFVVLHLAGRGLGTHGML